MAESRSVVKLCGVAGVALLALTSGALAGGSLKDEPKPEREFSYSFNVTGVSDYVFRGISLNDNDPTLQAAVNVGYGIFYAGIWGTGVDFAAFDAVTGDLIDSAEIEIDYYAGIKPTWGPATFDFGVIYYTNPGYSPGFDPEILELKAGVSGEVYKGLTAGVAYFYSPDYNDLEYGVIEATLAYALPKFWVFDPVISGLYGNQQEFDGVSLDYSYWNAGLTLAVEKISLDFRYWDNDISPSTSTTDERFVFSVGVTLP